MESEARPAGRTQPSEHSVNSTLSQIPLPNPAATQTDSGMVAEVKTSDESLQADRLQFAFRLHSYINDYIKVADQKAGFLFAIVTSLLAYMESRHLSCTWLRWPATAWGFIGTVSFFSTVALLVGAVSCFLVVCPRFKPKKRSGLIFWDSVTEHESANEYIRSVLGLQRDGLVHEVLDHHYRLSVIAATKYSCLSLAIWSTGIGVAFGLLAISCVPASLP